MRRSSSRAPRSWRNRTDASTGAVDLRADRVAVGMLHPDNWRSRIFWPVAYFNRRMVAWSRLAGWSIRLRHFDRGATCVAGQCKIRLTRDCLNWEIAGYGIASQGADRRPSSW